MERKKYSGYFCKKCKNIPLFQIIYKNNEIKIFSACKCHKQYEKIDSFIKHKYTKDILGINKISSESIQYSSYLDDNLSKQNINLDSIMKDFIKCKEKLNESATKIKNELINAYTNKIEQVNEIYNKYISNNNKVILVIEKLIESYNIIKNNPTIIENIKNNCIFNNKYETNNLLKDFNSSIQSSFQKIQNYFNKELIISIEHKSPIYKKIDSRYYPSSNDYIKSFIQLDDDICASCSENDNNIVLYNLQNDIKEKFIFKAHLKNVYSIIKTDKNNIISIGDDGLIKIWPIITKYFLLETKKKYDIENKNKFKFYPHNINKTIQLYLKQIFSVNYEYKTSMKIEKLFNLKNEYFLTSTKELINVYKYEINNNDIKLIKIKELEYEIVDIFHLIMEEKEIISICERKYIDFFDLDNFHFINKIDIKPISKNCLLQLNSKEILIVDSQLHLNVYNLDNFLLKLKIRTYNDIDFFLNLNDGTFIFSCFEGIKRYLIKTMEELPQLIKFNNNNYYEDYDYYDYDYDYYRETVTFLYELKDKRIVACHKEGTIDILNLKF